MLSRPRRCVAFAACAAVSFSIAVAVAVPTAQAAGDAVHAEWRGWVAYELEHTWQDGGGSSHHNVSRSWTVDVDPLSGNGEWAGNDYQASSTPGGHVCEPTTREGAGSGAGSAIADLGPQFEYGVVDREGGAKDDGYPPGTPMIGFGYVRHEGYFTVPVHRVSCGQVYEDQATVGPHTRFISGEGDYYSPPLTVANDVEWDEGWDGDGGDQRNHAVVCMTRSRVDSDNDGLPDEVDLAPTAAGQPLHLGHPLGSSVWSEIVPAQYGGPDGVRGLPSCPLSDPKRVMVSLGDSYSSGEGVYGYDPKTDDPGVNHCHRANSAYARVGFWGLVVAGSDLQEVHSLACSGAVWLDLLTTPFCGSGCGAGVKEAPQIKRLRELEESAAAQVELVTLGIGGNDAGFAKVIGECLTPLKGNCIAAFEPTVGGTLPKASPEEVVSLVSTALTAIKTEAPNADIVLVGYPVFISAQPRNCPTLVGGKGIGDDEARWIREQILYINWLFKEMVQGQHPDVKFLSLEDAYGDNVLCNGGSGDTQWVHSAVTDHALPDQQSCIATVNIPIDFFGGRIAICNESFHPKAEGHAAAGAALAECVLHDRCGTLTNPYLGAKVRQLEPVHIPVCANPVDCLVHVGEPVRVRASGFLPGREVSVALYSRSVELGSATASADGSVELDVVVPAGAATPGHHRLVITGPGDDTIVRAAVAQVSLTCGSGFSDVAVDHPFCGDITWMKSSQVTSGYSDGTFRPGLGLSRAQMASFLWRLAGQPVVAPSAPSFADLAADSPHATAVRWLAARGITTGYADGTFKPDLGLTRAHMAAFLHRFAEQPAPSSSAPTFPDVPADNQFATAISWLAEQGVTRGKSDGTFGPNDGLTRQQMAAFLHRFGEPRGLPE